MCKKWGELAKDFDRGVDHNRPDFSYVNAILEDNGCRDYLRWNN